MLWAGVFGGAVVAVPLALAGGLLGARAGGTAERWFDAPLSALGRFPTILTTLLVAVWAGQAGMIERIEAWGVIAILSRTPVMWRITSTALSSLPKGSIESGVGLGMSRLRALWISGAPVLIPAMVGAVVLGLPIAVLEAWIARVVCGGAEFQQLFGGEFIGLAVLIAISTLVGSFLLTTSRRRSRNMDYLLS